MGEPGAYTPCANAPDGPGVPEGVACERPRGHSWHHRKSIGGASMTWPNTARVDDRAVRVNLPLCSLDLDAEGHGKITPGAHQLLTLLGWTPPPGEREDDTAEAAMTRVLDRYGVAVGDDEWRAVFVARMLTAARSRSLPTEEPGESAPPVEAIELAAEWRTLDEWRLGIERVACLDPSCSCDADETSILVDDVTELSLADMRQLISNHRNAQTPEGLRP